MEFSGALAELLHGPVLRDYPSLDPDELRVTLVEAGARVLGGMSARLSEYALQRLHKLRVQVRIETTVERIDAEGVHLGQGASVATHTVVWAAGVKGTPRAAEWGFPVGRGGRVKLRDTLQLDAHPEVFVVGDLAYSEDAGGDPLPQVAQVAMQGGVHSARGVLRVLDEQSVDPFHYRDLGSLAVIGRNAAVAELGGRAFRGFPAWFLWLTIHIVQLIGFRNRLIVLVNWAWNYLSFGRAVRLILPAAREDRTAPRE